jgi:RNA-directed DNA polymerase
MLSAKDLITHMSSDMGMLPDHLKSIIRTAPLRYKVFYIPKRNGGTREVAQPAREVKAIQRWLVRKLKTQLPLHSAATAYRSGSSICLNASQHSESNYLLKMDFRDFFPSISLSDIVRHLEIHCGEVYDESAIRLIAYVCAWAPKRQRRLRLCIGAPSSPLLSNSVMYDFDSRLAALALADGVTYTRYADDIALSSRDFGIVNKYTDLVANLAQEIAYPRLVVNTAKTVLASRAGRRVVTGITLTPDFRLSIGRERKRLIRAMYHRHLLGQLSPEEQQKLSGLLAFADSIEPGFSARLKKSSESR